LNRKVLVAGVLVAVPLLAVLLLNLGRDPQAAPSPLVGLPAPPFSLTPVGGGPTVTLASLRGRPVVLNFWATWCIPCVEEHSALTQTARSRGSEVHFLGIVYNDEEVRIQSFLHLRDRAYPSLMDQGGKTAIAYGVHGVPETYFVDPRGVIVSKFVGPLNPEALAEELKKAGAS
jgi:cytochrome c biogenesis protein CcmG/thiol:disulfide interchange protein DsbE